MEERLAAALSKHKNQSKLARKKSIKHKTKSPAHSACIIRCHVPRRWVDERMRLQHGSIDVGEHVLLARKSEVWGRRICSAKPQLCEIRYPPYGPSWFNHYLLRRASGLCLTQISTQKKRIHFQMQFVLNSVFNFRCRLGPVYPNHFKL